MKYVFFQSEVDVTYIHSIHVMSVDHRTGFCSVQVSICPCMIINTEVHDLCISNGSSLCRWMPWTRKRPSHLQAQCWLSNRFCSINMSACTCTLVNIEVPVSYIGAGPHCARGCPVAIWGQAIHRHSADHRTRYCPVSCHAICRHSVNHLARPCCVNVWVCTYTRINMEVHVSVIWNRSVDALVPEDDIPSSDTVMITQLDIA